MHCTNCGVQQSSGANFCSSCGHRLGVAETFVPDLLTAPTPNPGPTAPKNNPQSPPGIKWLIYWAYIHLPLSGIICFGIGVFLATKIAWLGAIVIAICVPYLAASIGIYRRRRWGWWLNWLTIALTSVNGLVPNSYETIGDPVTLQVVGEFAIRMFFVSVIWILPNIVYWRKRLHLFS